MSPRTEYVSRRRTYEEKVEQLSESVNIYSRLRLFSFSGGFGLSFYFYLTELNSLGFKTLIITLLLFLGLVFRHEYLKKELVFTQTLFEINKRSYLRITGNWHEFEDTGLDFKDDKHPYTSDLDIIGQGSLFQWTSAARTDLGRKRFHQILTQPLENVDRIHERQGVILELADMLDWRQRFEGYGYLQAKSSQNPESLLQWGKQRLPLYRRAWLLTLTRLLPLITVSMLFASAMNWVPFLFPLLLLLIQFVLTIFFRGQERNLALSTVAKFKEDLKTYERMLHLFETTEFKSPYLNQLQESLKHKRTAYRQIKDLESLADWIANRHNAIFFIINILTLWDFHFMSALEHWKARSGPLLENWLEGIAELEALASLAIIRHDHPDWALPVITDDSANLRYEGKAVGHPLLWKPVTNDVKITPPNQVLLITGSNMSGKSTFLRTAGINLVLAYAGAPVCAKELTCSIVKVYTCMRVSDNLEQNISSFYAEILRIRKIVEASTHDRKVFFLLDEIFKGTNSIDRHTGAQLLIKRLIGEGAIGLVSTHDLELGSIEQKYRNKVKNYHFREYYLDSEIRFDYELRPGVSKTRNAIYLIKMAGIISEKDN